VLDLLAVDLTINITEFLIVVKKLLERKELVLYIKD